jgi:hypothetical protein
MKSPLGILALAMLLGGSMGLRNAVADTEVGIDDSLPVFLVPNGIFTMFNAVTIATDSENAILGAVGIFAGGLTLGIGLLFWEPAVIGAGAITTTVSIIAYRRASNGDASTSTISLEPVISRNDYGVSLSVRF